MISLATLAGATLSRELVKRFLYDDQAKKGSHADRSSSLITRIRVKFDADGDGWRFCVVKIANDGDGTCGFVCR